LSTFDFHSLVLVNGYFLDHLKINNVNFKVLQTYFIFSTMLARLFGNRRFVGGQRSCDFKS
jgi:hypothetical protein